MSSFSPPQEILAVLSRKLTKLPEFQPTDSCFGFLGNGGTNSGGKYSPSDFLYVQIYNHILRIVTVPFYIKYFYVLTVC